MVNKAISPNLAPWNWRTEKAPEHINLGPNASKSANEAQGGVSLESHHSLAPQVAASEQLPHREQRCLEDGKDQAPLR